MVKLNSLKTRFKTFNKHFSLLTVKHVRLSNPKFLNSRLLHLLGYRCASLMLYAPALLNIFGVCAQFLICTCR